MPVCAHVRSAVLFLLVLCVGASACYPRSPGATRSTTDAGAARGDARTGPGDARDARSPVDRDAGTTPAAEASCGLDDDPPPPTHCQLPETIKPSQGAKAVFAALLLRAHDRNEAGLALRRAAPARMHIAGRSGESPPEATAPSVPASSPADPSDGGTASGAASSTGPDDSDGSVPLFREALACANTALRIQPNALPALRQRALAQRELYQVDEARDTLTRTLLLFPDDAEALALSADLYISHLSATREHSEIGLLYAERGRMLLLPKPANRQGKANKASKAAKAGASRRKAGAAGESALSDDQRELLSRLWLLSGQALLDLGRASEALPALDAALRLRELPEARYERAVALFELVRLPEAQAAFRSLIDADSQRKSRQAAFCHYHLGLVLEQLGPAEAAQKELDAAHAILPEQFPDPLPVSMTEFQALVHAETLRLPPDEAADLKLVRLELSDLPDPRDLTLETPPLSPTILGLFRGLPLGDEPSEPRSIVLYRKNLLRAVRSKAELIREIKKTLLHELGHLHGADEDDLREEGLE